MAMTNYELYDDAFCFLLLFEILKSEVKLFECSLLLLYIIFFK